MDVYRLADGYSDIDFDEYFYGDGVTVVEWGTIIDELLPAEYLAIEITRAEGYGNGAPGFTEDGYGVGTSGGLAEEYGVVASEKRIFRLTPHGKRYQEICEVLINSENSSS
jgi:tRNA threonylcarbamoyladenosine biosynthesis protein TsaE